jgi:hypothetical protein
MHRVGSWLASLFLALAPAGQPSEIWVCSASFSEGSRIGYVNLVAADDYRLHSMTIRLSESDGWTQAEIALDPNERRLPGTLSHVFFVVRFTRKPAFPLTMNAYADGRLRWRKSITVPFWPTTLIGPARVGPGTAAYIARADDNLPVPTPRRRAFPSSCPRFGAGR